jgi:hypothetical protein
MRQILDRVVALESWAAMHLGATVPRCMLYMEYQPLIPHQAGPQRFEAEWLREEGFRETVQRAWEGAASVASSGVLAKCTICTIHCMHGTSTF